MRLVRFDVRGRSAYGILNNDEVTELDGDFFSPFKTRATCHAGSGVKLLAPCIPSKIIAVGLNYRDHARELGMPVPETPVIFLKPRTSIIGPGDVICRPAMTDQVDYEAELGVVIRDRIRNVGLDEALDHVLGYTCANDVTARDLQKMDGQWTRAKSFDTFCPVGPWIETDLDPDDLLVESYLNGERRQSSRTSQCIFSTYAVSSVLSPGS
jgi:2-keto-4-pentenoate hydratase/2-oxohepta-3-ene-1,7-dioic acid hydratase in catechol pathway